MDRTPAALDAMYERLAPRLLAFVRLKLGQSLRERLESRDIVQATLLKSWQKMDEFKGEDSPALQGWLMRIAEREILDRVDFHGRQQRDARREEPVDDYQELAARSRSILSRLILDERANRLEAAMETLPEAQREIILLRAFRELSFPEIARLVGKSEDASRMAYARAMTALTLALAAADRS